MNNNVHIPVYLVFKFYFFIEMFDCYRLLWISLKLFIFIFVDSENKCDQHSPEKSCDLAVS
jgi:hypothetical protein